MISALSNDNARASVEGWGVKELLNSVFSSLSFLSSFSLLFSFFFLFFSLFFILYLQFSLIVLGALFAFCNSLFLFYLFFPLPNFFWFQLSVHFWTCVPITLILEHCSPLIIRGQGRSLITSPRYWSNLGFKKRLSINNSQGCVWMGNHPLKTSPSQFLAELFRVKQTYFYPLHLKLFIWPSIEKDQLIETLYTLLENKALENKSIQVKKSGNSLLFAKKDNWWRWIFYYENIFMHYYEYIFVNKEAMYLSNNSNLFLFIYI